MFYKAISLEMRQIKEMVQRLTSNMSSTIKEGLLLQSTGEELLISQSMLGGLKDNIQEGTASYSLIEDSRN